VRTAGKKPLPVTRDVLEEVWPEGDSEPLIVVESVVLSFHVVDSTGQALRYAYSKDGKSVLSGAPSRVDLENLRDVMDGVAVFFGGCLSGLDAGIDAMPDGHDYCW
jgi:hypothetical protein